MEANADGKVITKPATHYIQKSELFSFVGQALSEGNAVLIEERDGEYRVTLWKERKK